MSYDDAAEDIPFVVVVAIAIVDLDDLGHPELVMCTSLQPGATQPLLNRELHEFIWGVLFAGWYDDDDEEARQMVSGVIDAMLMAQGLGARQIECGNGHEQVKATITWL